MIPASSATKLLQSPVRVEQSKSNKPSTHLLLVGTKFPSSKNFSHTQEFRRDLIQYGFFELGHNIAVFDGETKREKMAFSYSTPTPSECTYHKQTRSHTQPIPK